MLIDKLLMHLYLKKHRLNALHVQKTHRVSEGYRVTKVINKIEAVLTAISLSSPFPLNFSSSKKPLYIYQYIVPHLSASLNSSFFNFIIIIFAHCMSRIRYLRSFASVPIKWENLCGTSWNLPSLDQVSFLSFMGFTVFEIFSRDLWNRALVLGLKDESDLISWKYNDCFVSQVNHKSSVAIAWAVGQTSMRNTRKLSEQNPTLKCGAKLRASWPQEQALMDFHQHLQFLSMPISLNIFWNRSKKP